MTIATFFEWEVYNGFEAQFISGWENVTRILSEGGSRGSRLFKNRAGNFCALALWPDFETRDRAFAPFLLEPTPDHLKVREAIKREIQRMDLDSVSDLWLSET